jgi:regulator of nonsense transcripts 1
VEGPLNNLKESMMQFSKPRKMMNPINPGTHFMTTTTYDAREYLNAVGSGFDRPNLMNGSGPSFYRPHDQMAYISAERAHNFSSLPVPIGMFMNIGHPLPARGYFNQQNQQQPNNGPNSKTGLRNRGRNTRHGVQFARDDTFGSQAASQEPAGHSFSDGPLTQAPLSMSQISQPAFTGFSQPVLSQAGLSQVCFLMLLVLLSFQLLKYVSYHSQDAYNGEDLRSQAEGIFSQDTGYHQEKGFLASQPGGAQYSQPY